MGGGGFNIFPFSILNTTGTAVLALRVAGRYLYAVVWQYMRRNRPFAERMDANCNYALRIVSNYFPYSLIVTNMILFPSLWPSHAKGQHISGSTLVRVIGKFDWGVRYVINFLYVQFWMRLGIVSYRGKKVRTVDSPAVRSVDKSRDTRNCVQKEPKYAICVHVATRLYYKALGIILCALI